MRIASYITLLIFSGLIDPLRADEKPIARIAFGSCVSQEKTQPIWEAVVATKPDLFLFLGDNIYADTDVPDIMRKKYAQLAAMQGFKMLRAVCPIMATWDDHDYGANDAGVEYRMKDESQRIFLDFFGVPKESPRRRQKGVYSSEVFGPPGKRVQVILLDTRYHRTKLKKEGKDYVADSDPSATFLGEEQWRWLGEQLKLPAELRLIGSSIQVIAQEHPFEKWSNFPKEQERLYQLLRDTKAAGVVILSGDRHLGELSHADAGLGYPLFDLTSSGLNQGNRRWRPAETNTHRLATMTYGDNFGLVLIDWERPEPMIRFQIRDAEGEVTIQQKIDLALLRPKAVGAATAAAPTPVGPGAVTPAEAAKRNGDKLTVEFAVKSTGVTSNKSRVFLNSTAARDPDNFTIVIDMAKAAESLNKAEIADPREHFKDKTIRVTGTVGTFRDSPQIVVEDAAQIEVVSK